MMGPEVIFYSLAILLVLILAGVQIGIALGVASVIGVYLAYGDFQIALSILGSTAHDAIRSHALAVIPLFMLMGEIISRSGAAADLYRLCDRALGRLPGRLAAATVLGNAAFATHGPADLYGQVLGHGYGSHAGGHFPGPCPVLDIDAGSGGVDPSAPGAGYVVARVNVLTGSRLAAAFY